MKRLVNLVDRGPSDDTFYPTSSNNTIFRRQWPTYQNAVPDIIELSYIGNAAWGQRITIPIKPVETGDMLQWVCLRLQPRSWMPPDMEANLQSGQWDYETPGSAWMWTSSLGTAAIQRVEFEIGDTLIEQWGGEWMDVWSRLWFSGGKAAVWDSDIYAQIKTRIIRDSTRHPWTTLQPTDDGYVYCFLPLAFMKRANTPFPLAALGNQEMRIHITLRPFHDVVRKRAGVRNSPTETPLGKTITLLDKTGDTPIPYDVMISSFVPSMNDATVFAGVIHLDEPHRTKLMREPREILYEPITHISFEIEKKMVSTTNATSMQFPLRELNGPIRELCWFLRRRTVWKHNEWTNYGLRDETELFANKIVQLPILQSARVMVNNAVWRDEPEQWWRYEYAMEHRGGVRSAYGMVYGIMFGSAAGLAVEELQPAGTVNASRAEIRLDLVLAPIPDISESCINDSTLELHVFATGLNWMRFVNGTVGALFQD